MIFIRVTEGEPVNGVYAFRDHGFETMDDAMRFKVDAVADGTYWGMFNMPAATLKEEPRRG